MTTFDQSRTQTGPRATHLFRIEDLEGVVDGTRALEEDDRRALRAVADWIEGFVAEPHKDLGRTGAVCPFVPGALERKALWLAPERIAGLSTPEVVQLTSGYRKLFLDAQPIDDDAVNYKAMVVVFTDLSPDRAKRLFGELLEHLAVPSYAEDGLVLGAFYESNEATAIYNQRFRPFTPPVPFLLVRHAVISDWKFFLDDKDWLGRWAHRYGESGVQALAEELRRLPWRASR